MVTKARPRKPTAPLYRADDPNIHFVGCLDPTAGKDYKQAIYALIKHDSTGVYYLCRNCRRRHMWVLDKYVREWKDRG